MALSRSTYWWQHKGWISFVIVAFNNRIGNMWSANFAFKEKVYPCFDLRKRKIFDHNNLFLAAFRLLSHQMYWEGSYSLKDWNFIIFESREFFRLKETKSMIHTPALRPQFYYPIFWDYVVHVNMTFACLQQYLGMGHSFLVQPSWLKIPALPDSP